MATIQLDLAGVLNYLAGTTFPGPMMGGDAAANAAWGAINGHGAKAATTGQSMLAALNSKAGTTGQGLNAVCNTLAGTTGFEADLALRIYAGIA